MNQYSLKVDASELGKGLKRIGQAYPRLISETPALFSFDGTNLFIALPGAEISARAEGAWANPVRVSASLIRTLARNRQSLGDRVSLTYADGKLELAGISVTAHMAKEAHTPIDVLPDISFLKLLQMNAKYTEGEIARSGMSSAIKEALKKRDKILKQAAKILTPLDVSVEELRKWLDARIKA